MSPAILQRPVATGQPRPPTVAVPQPAAPVAPSGPARLARSLFRHPRRQLGGGQRRHRCSSAERPDPVARAELYTAKGSPVGRPGAAPVAARRSAGPSPSRPARPHGADPRRDDDPAVLCHAAPDHLARQFAWPAIKAKAGPGRACRRRASRRLDPLVKADDAAECRAAADASAPLLSSKRAPKPPSASPGLISSVGRDADARRVADTWRVGATGEWASQSAWVSGLASWRMNDCNAASNAFRDVAA